MDRAEAEGTARRDALHVALYSGLYLHADAISTSLRFKLEALRGARAAALLGPVRTTVFAQNADVDDADVVRTDVVRLLTCPRFHRADVHVFEFGIHYDLFNAVFMVPAGRQVVGVYHNVTPPELADSDTLRRALERSLVQKHNLWRCDQVICDSEYNRDDLLRLGLPPERLTVLHLPPAVGSAAGAERPERHDAATVQLLYIGRFVPAKGVLDLARAVRALRRRGVDGFTVTLAGNTLLSSSGCVEEILRLVDEEGLGDVLRIVPSPTDATLARLLVEADALVLPSYHEGYCMPVVEALTARRYVIAYDSTNLPHVLGGLGTLTPTGDVDALAGAIETFVAAVAAARRERREVVFPTSRGPVPQRRWRDLVGRHLEDYTRERYEAGFLEVVRRAAQRRQAAVPA